jgi:hypothetical protein
LPASRERNLINAKAGTPVPAFFAGPPAQAGPNAWSTPLIRAAGTNAGQARVFKTAKTIKRASAMSGMNCDDA